MLLKNLRSGEALIITGNKTYELAGKYIEKLLDDIQYNVLIVDGASIDTLNFIKMKLKFKIGVVIGVGGGSKIDLAKKPRQILVFLL